MGHWCTRGPYLDPNPHDPVTSLPAFTYARRPVHSASLSLMFRRALRSPAARVAVVASGAACLSSVNAVALAEGFREASDEARMKGISTGAHPSSGRVEGGRARTDSCWLPWGRIEG